MSEYEQTRQGEMLAFESVSVAFARSGGLARLTRLGAKPPLVAVDGVSASVPAGGALGIVGESGSGKSTLVRAALGLERLSGGRILFKGRELGPKRSEAQRRALQMVFQDPGTTLNPAHSVRSTLRETLRVHRMVPRAAVDRRVDELLDLVRLPQAIAGRRPSSLSGGQKQRVAIARALSLEPEVLFADEATSALDVVVQAAVLDLLKELRRETGVTLVCVTHDLDLVRYICDQVVVLEAGRLVEAGPVPQTLDAPRDEYTVRLIGASPKLRAVAA